MFRSNDNVQQKVSRDLQHMNCHRSILHRPWSSRKNLKHKDIDRELVLKFIEFSYVS